jgi:hypothetical protein
MGKIGKVTRTHEIPIPDRRPEPIAVPDAPPPQREPVPNSPAPSQSAP